jgi:hypothetical protein
VLIHSKEGGEQRVRLRGGKEIALTLRPKSSVLLDAVTGERLLT